MEKAIHVRLSSVPDWTLTLPRKSQFLHNCIKGLELLEKLLSPVLNIIYYCCIKFSEFSMG